MTICYRGMRNYFLQVKGFVESNFPDTDVVITGGNYPPPSYAQTISSITGFIWFTGIAFLLGGSQIFKILGIPEPKLYIEFSNNKMTAFIILFVINNIGASLLSTGAFEMFLNDEEVYSKLVSGRLPNQEDLFTIFSSKLLK